MERPGLLVVLSLLLYVAGSIAQNPSVVVCEAGKYGTNCELTCSANCKTKPCDKQTGHCTAPGCAVGWKYSDRKCTTRCNNNRWGDNCTKACSNQCKSSCNTENGNCICKNGYQSPNCINPCADGTYGVGCQSICGKCQGGNRNCDHVSGRCAQGCQPGYSVPNCDNNCPRQYYGQDCDSTCGKCRSGSRCNPVNGVCPGRNCDAGFKPGMCQDACEAGRWGLNCRERCSEHCVNSSTCNKQNGHCDCQPGYQPGVCSLKCKAGRYGQDCGQKCGRCLNDTAGCDHVSGHCSSCEDNRLMPLCQDCIAGKFGSTCNQDCGHCGGDGACDPQTGDCTARTCLPGWRSAKCDQKCRVGFYGQDCAQKCGHCWNGNPCRHDNGVCEHDCEEGYEGVLCKRSKESLVGPLVGAIFGVGALIAIAIVVSVCFVMRRSRFKSITESKEDIAELAPVEPAVSQGSLSGISAGIPGPSGVYQNVEVNPSRPADALLPPASNYDRVDTAKQREEVHHYETHSALTAPQPAPLYQQDEGVYQNTAVVMASSPRAKSKMADLPEPEGNYGNL